MVKHGGKRVNAGRKTKAEELKLVERLTPLSDLAYRALEQGLKDGNALFVKMWFEYMHGKPNQKVDVNATVEATVKGFTQIEIIKNDK